MIAVKLAMLTLQTHLVLFFFPLWFLILILWLFLSSPSIQSCGYTWTLSINLIWIMDLDTPHLDLPSDLLKK